MKHQKLSKFLADVSSWRWDEFVRAEKSLDYSSSEAIIFALIRACAMEDLTAIKLTLNRIDGPLKTPVKIEYPKIFIRYPNATTLAAGPKHVAIATEKANELKVLTDDEITELNFNAQDEAVNSAKLPAMGLREALVKMSEYPKALPKGITDLALQTEQWIRKTAEQPAEIPMVKSVVAAHLLTMAQKRDMAAIYEVFDQIDGKLVETIQLIGEDLYLDNWSLVAPAEAYLNKEGVYEIEASDTQKMWAQKLGEKERLT